MCDPNGTREKQANAVSSQRWYSFTGQEISKNKKYTYVAQEPKSHILWSRKPAIKCRKDQKDQNVMLPHKPDTMVKDRSNNPEKVLKNKNCSNVDMQPQKPSYSDERLKKPVTKYRYKYKKHQEHIICQDKQSQELSKLCVRVKRAHLPSVVIGGQ